MSRCKIQRSNETIKFTQQGLLQYFKDEHTLPNYKLTTSAIPGQVRVKCCKER